MNGPWLVHDRLFRRFYCAPAAREVHGSWNFDPGPALRFDTRAAAENKAGALRRNMSRADRWRIEVVPLADALLTPAIFYRSRQEAVA